MVSMRCRFVIVEPKSAPDLFSDCSVFFFLSGDTISSHLETRPIYFQTDWFVYFWMTTRDRFDIAGERSTSDLFQTARSFYFSTTIRCCFDIVGERSTSDLFSGLFLFLDYDMMPFRYYLGSNAVSQL
jgi:hypothetical protein